MQNHCFVIPAYKNSPYLESCILSLLAQTVKSDVILTTSTPSAFIEDLAKKYSLSYFVTDVPSSIASDWNFAIAKSTAKLVTIAHQDDVYDPFYTEAIVKEITKRPQEKVLLAFTNYSDLVNDKVRGLTVNALIKATLLLPFSFSKSLKSKFFKKSILLFGDPICCPAVTINLNALPKFKFSTAYTCALDWFAWIEIAKQEGSFLYINKKLVKHRIHFESETTNQISNGKRQAEELKIFELLWGKKMAKLIAKIYSIGYKDNQIS